MNVMAAQGSLEEVNHEDKDNDIEKITLSSIRDWVAFGLRIEWRQLVHLISVLEDTHIVLDWNCGGGLRPIPH